MNYCFLLAGGSGTRMGNTGVPKQFLNLEDKPIIIHTLEKIIAMKSIDKIIVVCNENYIAYLKDLMDEYSISRNVYITRNGNSRLNSVLSGIDFVEKNFGINDDDIFVAHDSVRPFISERIIEENVCKAKKHKAATTVLDLIETIVETKDGEINKAYPRSNLFTGQSPQTFNISYFLECTKNVPLETQEKFTDLSECVLYNGGTVLPVMGDRNNIKITTPIDLIIANQILKNSINNK